VILDTTIEVLLDGISRLTYTSAFNQNEVGAGLYASSDTASRFDNCLVSAHHIDSPILTYAWAYSHGGAVAQESYQVLIYASNQVTVVYDSGRVRTAPLTSHQQPLGYLTENQQYHVQVTVWDAEGFSSASALVPFLTDWPSAPDLTGVVVSADDAYGRIQVTWDESTLTDAEFLRYRVYVSRDLGVTWTHVADILPKARNQFNYHDAGHGEEVWIGVGQVQVYYAFEVESWNKATGTATLALEGAWLHDAADPETYNIQLLFSPGVDFSWEKDQVEAIPMGRSAPVRHRGRAKYARGSLSYRLTAYGGQTAAEQLARLEALDGHGQPCIYRDRRGQRRYVNVDVNYTCLQPWDYTVQIAVTEASYTPAVQVVT